MTKKSNIFQDMLKEGKKKEPSENTIGYTIQDTDKLLDFIRSKFLGDIKNMRKDLYEAVTKIINS